MFFFFSSNRISYASYNDDTQNYEIVGLFYASVNVKDICTLTIPAGYSFLFYPKMRCRDAVTHVR